MARPLSFPPAAFQTSIASNMLLKLCPIKGYGGSPAEAPIGTSALPVDRDRSGAALALIQRSDERWPGGLAVAQRHGPRRRAARPAGGAGGTDEADTRFRAEARARRRRNS